MQHDEFSGLSKFWTIGFIHYYAKEYVSKISLTFVGFWSIISASSWHDPKLRVHPFEPCPVLVYRLEIVVRPEMYV